MTHAVAIGKYVIGLVIDMIWNGKSIMPWRLSSPFR